MYTLTQTFNWAKPFIQYSPLTAGIGQEPGISTGSMIRNTILGAPITWPWNRAESLNNAITSDTQDYTINLTDFGFLEKATLTDDSGKTTEIKYILNNAPLSQASPVGDRPNTAAVLYVVPYTSVTIRLMGMPTQNYTLDLTYQKIAVPFLPQDTITQVIVPNGAYDVLSSAGGSVGSTSISESILPTATTGISLFGVAAEGNASLTNPTTPAGWTVLNTGTDLGFWSLATTQGTPVSVSTSYTVSNSGYAGIAGVLVNIATTATPGVTNVVNNTTGNLNSGPVTLAGPYTINSGTTIAIAFVALGQAVGSATIPATISSFTDNHSNVWTKIAEPVLSSVVGGSNYWATGMSVWYTLNPTAASNYTFTLNGAGTSVQNQNFNLYLYALSNTTLTPTNPIYVGTFTPGVYQVGGTLTASGFANNGNNGTFPILSINSLLTPTQITVTNGLAMSEIHAAQAGNMSWSPIPDNFMEVYNNLFLSEAFSLTDDARSQQYRQRGIAAFLARAEGLIDAQKNAFLQQWGVDNHQSQSAVLKTNQGVQARGI